MNSHLKDINESYFEHMLYALKYGFKMLGAGIACILHAIFPDIFVTAASDTIKSITSEIEERKQKKQLASNQQ